MSIAISDFIGSVTQEEDLAPIDPRWSPVICFAEPEQAPPPLIEDRWSPVICFAASLIEGETASFGAAPGLWSGGYPIGAASGIWSGGLPIDGDAPFLTSGLWGGGLLIDGDAPFLTSDIWSGGLEIETGRPFLTSDIWSGGLEIETDAPFLPSGLWSGAHPIELPDFAPQEDIVILLPFGPAKEGGFLHLGTAGADEMTAGEGDDVMRGYGGGDELRGRAGDDVLFGNAGDDLLFGNKGRDVLAGGRGDDTLKGGLGGDRFVFNGKFGDDTILDFNADGAREVIDLQGVAAIEDFEDLLANHLVDGPQGALIEDLNGNSILLVGVEASELSADDFLF